MKIVCFLQIFGYVSHTVLPYTTIRDVVTRHLARTYSNPTIAVVQVARRPENRRSSLTIVQPSPSKRHVFYCTPIEAAWLAISRPEIVIMLLQTQTTLRALLLWEPDLGRIITREVANAKGSLAIEAVISP